jgi:hypothetical protein
MNTADVLGECHGLVPWIITLATTSAAEVLAECHGLVPWIITFAATSEASNDPRDKPVAFDFENHRPV